MKNKKVVILLLILAAGIWGTVIYRIFKTVHKEDTVQRKPAESKPDFSSLPDTFSIVADYRDPFLGKRVVPQSLKKVTTPVVKPKPEPVASTIKWPALSYSGIIKNKNDAKELALVKIDQKEFIMRTGEVMQGVQLSKIFKDSIVVLYQKEKKVIMK